jgi:tetratricopeptide (TPR) repeat protein
MSHKTNKISVKKFSLLKKELIFAVGKITNKRDMSKMNNVDETNLENIESSLTKAEQFIEKNYKKISIALVAVVVIIAGYKMYNAYVKLPFEKEASNAMFQAQYYFEQDSLKLALNGDGNAAGFNEISSEFSGSKAANLANFYAGICYLNLGQFQKAIDKFEDFSTNDELFKSKALGLIGDAYSELNKLGDAVSYYKKAASVGNSATAPKYLYKAAVIAEKQNKKSDAIACYETIKNDYPKSVEARDADKLIQYLK